MNQEKIQKLIEKMLEEDKKIKSVTKAEDDLDFISEEYYFTFPDETYSWSITQNPDGEVSIFFYPSKNQKSVFIRVGSNDISPYYQNKVKELFDVIRGKLYGFDDVLDDILEDKPLF